MLWQTLHVAREDGLPALRDAIVAAIEELQPPPQAPSTARTWRVYGMLRYRYVVGLSQEATADKLAITTRHLRRSYAEAVHALSVPSGKSRQAPPTPWPHPCLGRLAHPPPKAAGTSSWCVSWKRWQTPMPALSPRWPLPLQAWPAWRRT